MSVNGFATAARREALAALNSARKSGSATPRERAYIDALAQYYEVKPKAPADTATPDERLHAYRDAMRDVTRNFPTDDEAKIFYGLAIIAAGPYGDTTFTEQKRADSVLLPLVAKYPTHPGLFHYIIHANDEPQLAPLALDAARRYAQLAPAIPHAQHMPSHIFIRLGLWHDVIASNVQALAAGTAYARREKMDGEWPHNVHTMDFLQYAYLQEGRDRDAERITERVVAIEKLVQPVPDNAYIRYFKTFFPARQLLEQGRWREAAAFRLTEQPDTAVWSNVVRAFTNGLGAARSGDRAAASAALGRLGSLRGEFLTQKDTAAARITANMQTSVSAWLQLALGNRDEAERLARQAAAIENAASGTPLLPAIELEGELLQAVGKPADARTAFEASLRRSPNRSRSLYGAAQSAAQAGDAVAAGRFYRQYLAVMSHSDGNRPELVAAKQFLASR